MLVQILCSDNSHHPAFVTDIPPCQFFLAVAGSNLTSSPLYNCMLQALFLAQLPRCHAAIPNFPVTGREAQLTWQQRLQARTAQYHWHAPAERLDGSLPDFTDWDGNPNDSVNFPIAHSRKDVLDAEAAAASRVRSLGSSRSEVWLEHS